MSLNKPRSIFGIHSMCAVSRTTGLPYGIAKVLGNANVGGERDSIPLFGGSNPNEWDNEDGNINNDIAVNVKEFHPMFFELSGYNKTVNAAEAAGSVSALTDKLGTVINATTGIASVGLKSGESANLKDGDFTVKVVSATTVDVYCNTDISFSDGTAVTYQDDTGKITASPLTIPDSGAAVEVPGTGVELIGGSGTVNLETAGAVGDTATFTILSINEGSNEYDYDADPRPIEFGAYFFSQKKANGEYQKLYVPRCKFVTFPYGMTEKDWTGADLTLKVLFDNTEGFSKKIVDVVKDAS